MNIRFVRTFRTYSRAWDGNGMTLEANDDATDFRSIHEVVNGHLEELQAGGMTILTVQAQDTLLGGDIPTLCTTYTVLYEEAP